MERSYFHAVLEYFQALHRLSQAYDPDLSLCNEEKKQSAPRQSRLKQPFRALDHTRSRSRDHLTLKIKQQCPVLQQWMKDSLEASDPHLSLFETLTTDAEKWTFYLVIYGKALYRLYEEEIRTRWTRFEASNIGNCEWNDCIQAMLCLVHAHTLRTLIILPDNDLLPLIWKKRNYWGALTLQNLNTVLALYQPATETHKALLLEMLYDGATETDAEPSFYERIGHLVACPALFSLWSVPPDTLSHFQFVMTNRDIVKQYRTLLPGETKAGFEERYSWALEEFRTSVHTALIRTFPNEISS